MRVIDLVRLFAMAAPFAAGACLADPSTRPTSPRGVVAIALPDFDVFEGDTVPLKADVRGADGASAPDAPVRWASLDPGVATVDTSGALITIRPGTARVVARSGELADTASLVVRRLTVLDVTIAGIPDSLSAGDVVFFEVRALGEGQRSVRGRATTLVSNDPAVAVVDPSGRLRVVAPGRTTISAVVDGVAGSAPVTVGDSVTRIPLAFVGGVKLPIFVAADSVVWDGVAEYHEVYLETGSLQLSGAPQPRYMTMLRYREYAVVDDGAGGTTRLPRLGWLERDWGIVEYDALGNLAMTSELTAPVAHVARVEPAGFAMRYRIPGGDSYLELFFRR